MIVITDEILERIARDLKDNGIRTQDLHDNLLDHICCILEAELHDLSEFEKKYPEIRSRFYKQNFVELEKETQQLLIFKNYYAMKKTMIISGSLTSTFFVLGAFLKYFHLPGASAALVLGIVFFSFLFLPLMVTLKMKESTSNRDKIILILGLLTGIVASMSVLFKLMWWPGANIMWRISLFSLLLVFLPAYFFSGFRNPISKVNTIVTTILLLAGGGMLISLTAFTTVNSPSVAIDMIEENVSTTMQAIHAQNESISKALAARQISMYADSPEIQKELMTTNAILKDLQSFKTGLIARVENIPVEQADVMQIENLTNSNNSPLVKSILANDQELSLAKLFEKINQYNTNLSGKPAIQKLTSNEKLFSNTQLHFVVHSLNQLIYQAEVNRQALLNFQLGTLEKQS